MADRTPLIPNPNLVETTIHMIGDKRPIKQVVLLLAYIRHALTNNQQCDIHVKLGDNVSNSTFTFDVNGFQVDDFRTQKEIQIN